MNLSQVPLVSRRKPDSHATVDPLISALNKFIKKETDTKLRHISVVVFADEATSNARKEMVGIFLSYNEEDQELVIWNI